MADFDPDAYLAAAAPTPFNPDEYLQAVGKPSPTTTTQTFVPGSPREIAREQLVGQPVVQQQMERAGRAVADTATGFVKGLPSMLKFIKPPSLTDVLTGAAETLGQVKQARESPIGSQEWWNAVVPLASQYAMQVGALRVGAPKLTESLFGKEKPPVQPLAAETAATKEVIKNASEIPSAERVPSAQVRPGVDEKAPLRQQGQAPEVREKAQESSVAPVPQPEQPLERLQQPAIRLPNGQVFTGENHGVAMDFVPAGSVKPGEHVELGFSTNKRPFVESEEAFKIAKAYAPNVKPRADVGLGTIEAREAGAIPPVSEAGQTPAVSTLPEQVPQIPEGAKVNVKLRTNTGEMREARGMDAREAEGIFTKEKSSYQALLNCLGGA